jgi:hypothetical protein
VPVKYHSLAPCLPVGQAYPLASSCRSTLFLRIRPEDGFFARGTHGSNPGSSNGGSPANLSLRGQRRGSWSSRSDRPSRELRAAVGGKLSWVATVGARSMVPSSMRRTQQALRQVRRRQEHDEPGDLHWPGHAAEYRLAPLYVDHSRHRSRPQGTAAGYDARGIGRCPQGPCKGLGWPRHPLSPPDIGRAPAALDASADVRHHP